MSKPKKIILVDASSLKNSACIRRFYWDVVEGYSEKGNTVKLDIVWGSAFHKFRAIWRATKDAALAINEATKLFKLSTEGKEITGKKYLTDGLLTLTCMDYVEKYSHDDPWRIVETKHPEVNLPVLLVEPATKFMIPFIITDEVELYIVGTLDSIEVAMSRFAFFDCKTSGTWKIREFFESYKLDPQMMLYRWALRKYAEMHPGSIWEEIEATNPACYIDGVFHKQDPQSKLVTVSLVRNEKPIVFSDYQLEEFEKLLRIACEELLDYIDIKVPFAFGKTNGACKWCDRYKSVCAMPDRESLEAELENNFTKRFYNPVENW